MGALAPASNRSLESPGSIGGHMALNPGDQAPDFTLPDQHGNPVSLSGLRGKTVVLYFYPKAEAHGRKSNSEE